jgi:hypothetical protein
VVFFLVKLAVAGVQTFEVGDAVTIGDPRRGGRVVGKTDGENGLRGRRPPWMAI